MNKEEKFIEQKFGRENHFTVPEGYFDDFTSQLMQKLPEDPMQGARIVTMKASPLQRYHAAMIAAASVCAVIFSVGIYFHSVDRQPQKAPVAQAQQAGHDAAYSNTNVEAMAEYTMLDTEDMYSYIADNGY